MFEPKNTKKGQALIILAFAIFGLFGITALAIDASNAFSVRRHAQTAADNAAIAAAQALSNSGDYQVSGRDLAAANGFINNVQISMTNLSSTMGPNCKGNILIRPADIANEHENYILVVIRTSTNTYFGPIIGINQVHSCVEAISKASIYRSEPLAYGNAIAAMDCHASRAINASGSSTTVTIGGGVFSNSDASDGFYALKQEGLSIDAGYAATAVGGFDLGPGFTKPGSWLAGQTALQVCPTPEFWYPGYGTPNYPNPINLCTPGNTYANFPNDSFLTTINGKPAYQLVEGTTYCITGNFEQHSNKDIYGKNVHFILFNYGLHWNGNAGFFLSAAVDNTPLSGILFYLPLWKPIPNPTVNTDDVIINGSANSELTGTVFAPNSAVQINGDYAGESWTGQLIGKTVDLSGSSNLTINYDSGVLGHTTSFTIFELKK